MACSNENCSGDGAWRPVLEMRSRKDGPITHVKFSQLIFCEEHKASSTLATFLSAEGFIKIAKFMRENGKKAPIQRNTSLGWERLSPELLDTISPLTITEPNPDDDLAF